MNRSLKEFILVLLYSILLLIFKEQLNGFILLFLGIMVFARIFSLNNDKDFHFAIFKMIVYSIPFSFTNVMGGSYSSLPLSWFNIFVIIFIIYTFLHLTAKKKVVLSLTNLYIILFLFLSITIVINSINYFDGLSQILDIYITFIFILLVSQFSWGNSEKDLVPLFKAYISSALVSGIGVIIQFVFLKYFNSYYGFIIEYGGNRTALGYLFSDFSFLSLFLASAALLLILIKKHININYFLFAILVIIILFSSIITSARTGFVSFIVVFSIISIIKLFSFITKGKIRQFISLLVFQVTTLFGLYIFTILREGNVLNDSGRSDINANALAMFSESLFLGYGFGGATYRDLVGPLPHNLLIQSLVQGGLIFTIPLFIILLLVLFKTYFTRSYFLPVLICVLIGSLFIPNIFASRFLGVLFALSFLKVNLTLKKKGDY